MEVIRKAAKEDASRLAEILIFAKRAAYRPIFQNDLVSFGEMQVLPLAQEYLSHPEKLAGLWVYDNPFVKGLVHLQGTELQQLYIDPFFQGEGIGSALLSFALKQGARFLWVLEQNEKALGFYKARGFSPTGERRLEPGTTQYLLRMEYTAANK